LAVSDFAVSPAAKVTAGVVLLSMIATAVLVTIAAV
jgi:hypothetical protein